MKPRMTLEELVELGGKNSYIKIAEYADRARTRPVDPEQKAVIYNLGSDHYWVENGQSVKMGSPKR